MNENYKGTNLFFFKDKNNKKIASLKISEDGVGYYLLKGSQISKYWNGEKINKKDNELREKIMISKDGILEENFFYTSPSTLGNLVYGNITNGYAVFINDNGISLGTFMGRVTALKKY